MTETRTDKICFVLLQIIALVQIVSGVAFILFSYGAVATTVLCTVTFFGLFATTFRKDVAAWVLFIASLVWLMQMNDAFAYFLFYSTFDTKVFFYAIAMSLLALLNIFLSNYFWTKSDSKPQKIKTLCIALIVVAFVLPTLSYAYRTHDIDKVSYRMYAPKTIDSDAHIVISIGEESTGTIVVPDRLTFKAIAINSDIDSNIAFCDNCQIRVNSFFSKTTKMSFIKNNTSGEFYDDYATLRLNGDNSCKPLEMRLSDLRW
jgi:hypothetical protein